MKRSALHRWHEKAGATLAEENGWYVPLRYSNAQQEAAAVSRSVGICDLSHIHEPLSPYACFLIAGPNVRDLLSKLTSLNLDLTTAYGAIAHVRSLVTHRQLGFLVPGFMVDVPRDYAEFVWESLLHAGEEFHITVFGLEASRSLEG
jgi:glycine cleavage system aminomethyltransferase T